MTAELAAYYAARAAEYERVYEKVERQPDLAFLRGLVAEYFRARRVLEIACGTGYWTASLAITAQSIMATDVGTQVLEVAKAKPWPERSSVTFCVADAFDLAGIAGDFDAAFAGFWWSHVPRERLGAFLDGLHHRLLPTARVMLLDNRYVEGSSTPISRLDLAGNTYQHRMLSTGAKHEILKNFPTVSEVRERLTAHGVTNLEVVELPYFWYATYHLAAA
jgi:2-polyprenyl-3-methyl-5-hydroxy-6-metoxy-1,4-benzoquinol methylase